LSVVLEFSLFQPASPSTIGRSSFFIASALLTLRTALFVYAMAAFIMAVARSGPSGTESCFQSQLHGASMYA